MKNQVLILFSILSLSSCTQVYSLFDGVYPVEMLHQHGTGETPEGFIVSLEEVHEATRGEKGPWNIYANSENYFASHDFECWFCKSGTNSFLASTRGVRISGKTRNDIEAIQARGYADERLFGAWIERKAN